MTLLELRMLLGRMRFPNAAPRAVALDAADWDSAFALCEAASPGEVTDPKWAWGDINPTATPWFTFEGVYIMRRGI